MHGDSLGFSQVQVASRLLSTPKANHSLVPALILPREPRRDQSELSSTLKKEEGSETLGLSASLPPQDGSEKVH